MTHIEQAVKEAVEKGGYVPTYTPKSATSLREVRPFIPYEAIFLDPLFWQALGKVEGWNDKKHDFDEGGYCKNCREWIYHLHLFIDHLAGGKDADSFFKELLK